MLLKVGSGPHQSGASSTIRDRAAPTGPHIDGTHALEPSESAGAIESTIVDRILDRGK